MKKESRQGSEFAVMTYKCERQSEWTRECLTQWKTKAPWKIKFQERVKVLGGAKMLKYSWCPGAMETGWAEPHLHWRKAIVRAEWWSRHRLNCWWSTRRLWSSRLKEKSKNKEENRGYHFAFKRRQLKEVHRVVQNKPKKNRRKRSLNDSDCNESKLTSSFSNSASFVPVSSDITVAGSAALPFADMIVQKMFDDYTGMWFQGPASSELECSVLQRFWAAFWV